MRRDSASFHVKRVTRTRSFWPSCKLPSSKLLLKLMWSKTTLGPCAAHQQLMLPGIHHPVRDSTKKLCRRSTAPTRHMQHFLRKYLMYMLASPGLAPACLEELHLCLTRTLVRPLSFQWSCLKPSQQCAEACISAQLAGSTACRGPHSLQRADQSGSRNARRAA